MYAKTQLGVPKGEEAMILGLVWKKETEHIGLKIPLERASPTKRGNLGSHKNLRPIGVGVTGYALGENALSGPLQHEVGLGC